MTSETIRRVEYARQRRLCRLVDRQHLLEDRLRQLKDRHRRMVRSVAPGASRPGTITVQADILAATQDLVEATQDSQATAQDTTATTMELEVQDMRSTTTVRQAVLRSVALGASSPDTTTVQAAIQDSAEDILDSMAATQVSQVTAQDTTATTMELGVQDMIMELVVQVMRVTTMARQAAPLEDIQVFLDMAEVTRAMIMAQWEELLAVIQASAAATLIPVGDTQDSLATAPDTKGMTTDPLDITTAPLEVTKNTVTVVEATLAALAADTLATPEVIRVMEAIAATK
ncbi:hypothetical protein AAVH_20844 [Aphelenchoides avenae]|nr:hypothetical protein AAVH_20844 [Aphelenchus avenae]